MWLFQSLCESVVVSPGFTSRPSLSALRDARPAARTGSVGVAGIHVPAFVERRQMYDAGDTATWPVSPGFTSRPSLSVRSDARCGLPESVVRVSPGFTSRPSLSAVHDD